MGPAGLRRLAERSVSGLHFVQAGHQRGQVTRAPFPVKLLSARGPGV